MRKLRFKLGFPGGSVVKNLPASAEDMRLILGSGRYPGKGNGNPLQYSCLGNPVDRVEQGRLQSMGSQVRQDLVTKHHHHCEVKNNS